MENLIKKYSMVISQDLIWRDMDAFQHVNNAVYFRYFEDVRLACLNKAKVFEYMDKTQIGPILASTQCNFRAPLTFPDTIQIGGLIENIKSKTFKMKYVVYSEGLKKVVADGEGLIVYYDYRRERSCEIPEPVLAAIKTLQSNEEIPD